MNLIPLYPRIIIERLKPEEKTSGGIILPSSQNESLRGRVLATYENCEVVKIGQTVTYKQYGGQPVDKSVMDGKDCLILDEEELTAIINE